jgi:hypothetical protein
MKSGLTVNDLASQIVADRAQLKDYIGDTRFMRMASPDSFMLRNGSEIDLNPTDLFHQQVADKAGIPQRYYDKMKSENPDLMVQNVNSWFDRTPSKRLVRTTNGRARAFLTDGYRPLDNYDVAENLLPVLAKTGLRIVSSQITETRLYIQAVSDRLTADVKVGDAVQQGITIRNSEVGKGSLAIEDLIWRLSCLNGAIYGNVMRQAHIGGSRRGDVSFAEEITFTSETRKLSDKAFWSQAKDAVAQLLTPESLDRKIEKMKRATKIEIEKPAAAIEMVSDEFNLNEAESDGVLAALIKGGDLTAWGMSNAVTAQAHDIADQDRAYEFEKIGARIIELPRSKWENN